jgi:pyruvate dehydrogenase E2 component (dihydrolipoamide acetyltransferase)
MTDLTMPRLSDSMEEGTILTWLIEDRQPVTEGDDLVEIETDKATMTWQADANVVLEILAPAGTTLPVGALIARVGDGQPAAAEPTTSEPAVETPAPGADLPEQPAALPDPSNESGGDLPARRIAATPLARRIATAQSVALDRVAGSGPHGRITRDDVLAAARLDVTPSRSLVPVPDASALSASRVWAHDPAHGDVTEQEPTRLQQLIARRMVEAKSTIPEFQVETEVVMDAAIALRAELKRAALDGDVVPSLNDLIVKASALALREHPRANASYREGRFDLYSRVNVGVAVAADDALIVPTVFDADTKSLGEIASDVRALARRVREGTSRPTDLEGGTFTVSNLGMYGMSAVTPVINPPQAAILGVGALREVLARIDGEIVDRTVMTLRLSCDHRILYGADAATFLARIRDLLTEPLRLMLR